MSRALERKSEAGIYDFLEVKTNQAEVITRHSILPVARSAQRGRRREFLSSNILFARRREGVLNIKQANCKLEGRMEDGKGRLEFEYGSTSLSSGRLVKKEWWHSSLSPIRHGRLGIH